MNTHPEISHHAHALMRTENPTPAAIQAAFDNFAADLRARIERDGEAIRKLVDQVSELKDRLKIAHRKIEQKDEEITRLQAEILFPDPA